MNLQESGEMYLETLFVLSKKSETVRSFNLAEHMGFTKPSVSRAISLLKADDYVISDEKGYLFLTKKGEEIAKKIYERHEVLTEFLVYLGVEEKTASKDACKLEHVISDTSFEAIKNHFSKETKKIAVTFYKQSEISDALLQFAVIAARYKDKWIFCRHKERSTWEIPGGHRKEGEPIQDTAKRELYEESGSVKFDLKPLAVYGVTKNQVTTYGMLFYANVQLLDSLPHDFEIKEIIFSDVLPDKLTYPNIQPILYQYVIDHIAL